MKTNKKITHVNGLSFQLDESNYTAKIINSLNVNSDIIIPTSISYESHEYTITTIGNNSFNGNKTIKTIQFENNSKLSKIEQDAFYGSSIESIFIPSSIIYLEEGWCRHTWKLNKFIISSDNHHFSYLDEDHQIILGKTNKNKEIYDVIIFSCHNIKRAIIPPTIKHIQSCAFSECICLKTIEFTGDSNLLTIGKESFARSTIESFSIQSKLVEMGEDWCNYTNNLNKIIISSKNKNFCYIDNDHNLIGTKTNPKKKFYNVLLFACRDIKQAIIPPTIKYISNFAFCGCRKLETIQFYNNSKLKIIGKGSFLSSSLQSILIPENVTQIKEKCFCHCDNLSIVKFSKHSKLKKIEKEAFLYSSIQKVNIPSSVEILENEWCANTPNLTKVSLSKRNKNYKFIDENDKKIIIGKSKQNKNYFDSIVFACRNITKAVIPSSIKYICPYAFSGCFLLESVSFSVDSELRTIGKKAFAYSNIVEIFIPSKIVKIEENSFSFCSRLQKIEFSEDSEIKSFILNSFLSPPIKSISIPNSIQIIEDEWIGQAPNLLNISISNKNENFSYLENEKKLIVGKSEPNKNYFDSIIFACRDINNVIIPSKIKQINSFAFSNCLNLDRIEFSNDSEIQTIKTNAFSHSSIDFILLPKSIKCIEKSAFSYCQKLKTLQFHDDSKISVFESNLFFRSNIENLSIPSNIEILKEGWCNSTEKLFNVSISPKNNNFAFLDVFDKKIIIGKSDKNQNFFDVIEFACRDIIQVLIPSTIKKISPFAFYECINLNKVEFSDDSNLISIGNDAFAFCNIEGMAIPENVKIIGSNAFQGCTTLKSIEFLGNNFTIDSSCFSKCSCLFVASFPNTDLVYIDNDAFVFTSKSFTLFICNGAKII